MREFSSVGVVYRKEGWLKRQFVIVDAAMNDLLRPALYDAHHHIWPVAGPASPAFHGGRARNSLQKVDVVGPICESSDCFAKDIETAPSARRGLAGDL